MTTELYAARPLTLGRKGRTPRTLRNRLASAPMERNYGTTDGHITEQYIDYLVTRAKAGLGLVTTEATYVRADGKGRTHQLGLHTDAMIPGLRALTDALHAEGALAAVELNHGGRTAQMALSGFKNLAPSPVPCAVAGGEIPRELTAVECLELVEAYGTAARRAVEAGFDVINIHGAHGYLIHQFMSPVSNHRTDEFAAPERFLNLVIDAVRAAAPDAIIGMRVSVVEGPEDGISADRQLEIIARAHLDQLDFLDLSAGSYEAGEWIVQSGEWKPGILADYARAYRRFGLPLGMAGRLNSPAIIEEVLREGTCDFVSLARAIHADPAFVGGVLSGERYRPCIACNVCIDNLGLGQVTCTVNPAVGRSRVPVPTPAVRAGTRVVVVGAGPAGLTAARELAEAGVQVTVLDDGARPGGQFALAERMKSTPDFHRFAQWSVEENARLGIDLRLGTRADTNEVAALARETGADAVVLATGGSRPGAGFPGGNSPKVSDIREWLAAHPDVLAGGDVPEAVTIWGADSVAMSVADTLADRGSAVLLIGPQKVIAPESGRRAKILAVPRLEANPQVRIRLGVSIEEYDGARVRLSSGDWLDAPGEILVSRSVLPLDGSVSARQRDTELSRAAGVPVTLAGTVVDQTPAIASNAVKSGYDAAQRVASMLAGADRDLPELTLNGAAS
ncbi:2,4-dienoyl-CoA reductase-like NADH-dependent reductase (Old Yellow Enzyme family)/thioredoxin reductase [Arthrobacter ginsengisoli]|uniref:2,4-dienoyl-CoA reductase-like NADH-dependent reductase (Old Yellow Enzyme family)/thioredoxin reductase n=1 Tax=Arthrobacter ginsengisoli TaxID=1356565 RepID=A0ABU1UBC0_9MICC|nr:FAD-dependent oxidoreductase [Arthrobacter ginsengisoli]MDR7082503.1 2,4-dienoyl-CoA reductase-like NADH-dependent reductase (Old Yellow Enzyme family)/thioredoxin reductase [Arthrobacter ginsengisoli]